MCLYEKIAELCKKKDVSIYQMCNDNNLSQSMVSNWKSRPDTDISLKTGLKLAKYFKVKPQYFLNEEKKE